MKMLTDYSLQMKIFKKINKNMKKYYMNHKNKMYMQVFNIMIKYSKYYQL